jgi:hypothetical protein
MDGSYFLWIFGYAASKLQMAWIRAIFSFGHLRRSGKDVGNQV